MAGMQFEDWTSAVRPDGDVAAELEWALPCGRREVLAMEGPPADHRRFVVPKCSSCGGMLKPHVVMFGENIPKGIVEVCQCLSMEADCGTGGLARRSATRMSTAVMRCWCWARP